MNLPVFDPENFSKAVRKIRMLTTEEPKVFEPAMKRLCRDSSVARISEPPIGKTCLALVRC
jgi:hypothetical protein